MGSILHVSFTDRMIAELGVYCEERIDKPTKTAVLRELVSKLLADAARARAKRIEAEHLAILRAAKVERVSKPRKPRGPTKVPPWIERERAESAAESVDPPAT